MIERRRFVKFHHDSRPIWIARDMVMAVGVMEYGDMPPVTRIIMVGGGEAYADETPAEVLERLDT